MERSASIAQLTKALVVFHRTVGKVGKDSRNPFFNSRYATLSRILDVVAGPLNEAGLAVSQWPRDDSELTTVLAHESGEFIAVTYRMKPVKEDPQGLGACITYQRRYALGAVLSLNIDEDDDGNAASGRRASRRSARPTEPTTTATRSRTVVPKPPKTA